MTVDTQHRALLIWATDVAGPAPYAAAAGAMAEADLDPVVAVAAPEDPGADIHLSCAPRRGESHLEFAQRGLADLADAFEQVHRAHRPRVVHAVGWLAALAWQRVLRADDAGRLVVSEDPVQAQGRRLAPSPADRLLPGLLRAADHVVAQHSRQADEYVTWGVPRRRISVIAPHPAPVPTSQPDAAVAPHALCVVGRDSREREAVASVVQRRLDVSAVQRPDAPDDEGAQVVLCLDDPAGDGRAVLSALSRGAAVVAADVGLHGDLVVDAVSGDLVAGGSPGEAARACERLLGDLWTREARGVAAQDRVASRFQAERLGIDLGRAWSAASPPSADGPGPRPEADDDEDDAELVVLARAGRASPPDAGRGVA